MRTRKEPPITILITGFGPGDLVHFRQIGGNRHGNFQDKVGAQELKEGDIWEVQFIGENKPRFIRKINQTASNNAFCDPEY